jgi:hypothetical protein
MKGNSEQPVAEPLEDNTSVEKTIKGFHTKRKKCFKIQQLSD